MARPAKIGLDYFSIDVDIFNDRKIKRLIRKCGSDGFMIYQYLLTQIYGDKGYYVDADEDLLFDVSDTFKIDEDDAMLIIQYCIDVNLFDDFQYEANKVLTSKSIQERYVSACEAMKRKNKKINPELTALKSDKIGRNEDNSELTGVSSEETVVDSELMPQSKVKESKVNKSKGEERGITSEETDKSFLIKKFSEWAVGESIDLVASNLYTQNLIIDKILERKRGLSISELFDHFEKSMKGRNSFQKKWNNITAINRNFDELWAINKISKTPTSGGQSKRSKFVAK